MNRGGARPGAGRKLGSVNRMTAEAQRSAADGGETPLEYMLRVMRDTMIKDSRRDDMAKAAAAYLHPRLTAVDHSGEPNVVYHISDRPMTNEEWEREFTDMDTPKGPSDSVN
jgi:hypothetical protein